MLLFFAAAVTVTNGNDNDCYGDDSDSTMNIAATVMTTTVYPVLQGRSSEECTAAAVTATNGDDDDCYDDNNDSAKNFAATVMMTTA